jgi:hypothetical protein
MGLKLKSFKKSLAMRAFLETHMTSIANAVCFSDSGYMHTNVER